MIPAELHQKTLLAMLVVASLAFAWILAPFYSAIFWGIVLAVLFTPIHHKLLFRVRMRKNLAAALTVVLCVIVVILPLALITSALVQEAAAYYQRIRSGELDLNAHFARAMHYLPPWLSNMLARFGLGDFSAIQRKIAQGAGQGTEFIATQAFNLGQNTFNFVISFGVMLYLLFFLLRDGPALLKRVEHAMPLSVEDMRYLAKKFAAVIRATVKGNIIVAAIQGALGGGMLAILGIEGPILWGALMAFMALLPALGAALVWGPVALYLVLSGSVTQGIILIVFGTLVIGLVDNLLRPVLVGKDIGMPDYVVFLSTIGGIAVFGLNGFVMGPVLAAFFITVWDLFSSMSPARNQRPTD